MAARYRNGRSRFRVTGPCVALSGSALLILLAFAMTIAVSNVSGRKPQEVSSSAGGGVVGNNGGSNGGGKWNEGGEKMGQRLFDRTINKDGVDSFRKRRVGSRPQTAVATFSVDGFVSQREEREMQFIDTYCRYRSFANLTEEELSPRASTRHMVDPPQGGLLSHVCCLTTAGPLSIIAHSNWAPLGAKRFVDMVKRGYFASEVPLMRCVKGFLCQFGIHGNVEVSARFPEFSKSMKDDPQWLPPGPTHRMNSNGVKRFAEGYLAYAGSGQNSRGNQLIVALKANGPLAGGSPWEVPWGELVGEHSFRTLSNIFTGYGEDGPSQGTLHKEGASEAVREKFPKLDYIQKCVLLDERDHSDVHRSM